MTPARHGPRRTCPAFVLHACMQKARPQRGAARTQVEEDEDEELQARLAAVRL